MTIRIASWIVAIALCGLSAGFALGVAVGSRRAPREVSCANAVCSARCP